jgi:hypothetical protein
VRTIGAALLLCAAPCKTVYESTGANHSPEAWICRLPWRQAAPPAMAHEDL